MEADFNAVYKIIFNRRIMPRLESNNIIPKEIIGARRTQIVIHLVLSKKLILDIVNIRKLPTITIYIDVTNCGNRVVYIFASLYVQYFGLNITYLLVLFKTI